MQIKLYLINFLLGAGLYSSIEVLYLQSRNVSAYFISLLILAIPLGTALLELPTGILGDAIGRKKIFRLTFLSFFLATVIILLSPNIVFIFIGYGLEALAYSFYSGNTESIIYETCAKNGADINKVFSNFYASLTAGYVVSGVFVNLLSLKQKEGILVGSVVATAIIRLIALILCFSITDIKDEISENKPMGIMKETFALVKKDKTTISICLYDAIGRLQYYLPVIYQPILIANGMSISKIALIYSLSQFAQTFAQKIAAYLINHVGMGALLKITPIIQGLSLLLILTNNTFLIVIGIVLVFSGISVKGQCTSLVRHSLVKNEIRSTYMSVISLVTLICNTILLNIIGAVLQANIVVAVSILAGILIIGSQFTLTNILSQSQ